MSAAPAVRSATGFDVDAVRRDFPILGEHASTASRSSTSTARPARRSRGR